MKLLEAKVERDIKKWCEQHKDELWWLKFTVPGMSGVPDRIALFRGGRCVFVELKRPGGKPRKLQVWVHKRLQRFGFPCHVFDNAEDCIRCLEEYLSEVE